MTASLITLVFIIVIAAIFDFINGFHDTANAIATSVATKVLTPLQAIAMAAVLNVLGALTGGAVAQTIYKDVVSSQVASLTLVAAALLSAITWNLITWWRAIPSSSSHALIFSLVGAGLAAGGMGAIIPRGVHKTLTGLLTSPVLGFTVPILVTLLVLWLVARHLRPRQVTVIFGRLQILSAAFMAFSHGGNDAQKTMGIMTLALGAYVGTPYQHVPLWIVLLCALAMGLGTATGGWRIIRTMGFGVVELRPIDGFAAEISAAAIIQTGTTLGIPVSTTHVISAAIMGVGATKGLKQVRWETAGKIVTAWVVTIPASIGMGWLFMQLAQHLHF